MLPVGAKICAVAVSGSIATRPPFTEALIEPVIASLCSTSAPPGVLAPTSNCAPANSVRFGDSSVIVCGTNKLSAVTGPLTARLPSLSSISPSWTLKAASVPMALAPGMNTDPATPASVPTVRLSAAVSLTGPEVFSTSDGVPGTTAPLNAMPPPPLDSTMPLANTRDRSTLPGAGPTSSVVLPNGETCTVPLSLIDVVCATDSALVLNASVPPVADSDPEVSEMPGAFSVSPPAAAETAPITSTVFASLIAMEAAPILPSWSIALLVAPSTSKAPDDEPASTPALSAPPFCVTPAMPASSSSVPAKAALPKRTMPFATAVPSARLSPSRSVPAVISDRSPSSMLPLPSSPIATVSFNDAGPISTTPSPALSEPPLTRSALAAIASVCPAPTLNAPARVNVAAPESRSSASPPTASAPIVPMVLPLPVSINPPPGNAPVSVSTANTPPGSSVSVSEPLASTCSTAECAALLCARFTTTRLLAMAGPAPMAPTSSVLARSAASVLSVSVSAFAVGTVPPSTIVGAVSDATAIRSSVPVDTSLFATMPSARRSSVPPAALNTIGASISMEPPPETWNELVTPPPTPASIASERVLSNCSVPPTGRPATAVSWF